MTIFIYKSIWLLISFIITFVYLLSWIKFQKYQFLERDYNIVAKHSEYSRKWHFFKGLNQVIFFYLIFISFGFKIALIDSTMFWIFFDGWLNLSVLKREFFYVGNTSKIDKTIQSISQGIQIVYKKVTPSLLSAFVKITTLIISLISFY